MTEVLTFVCGAIPGKATIEKFYHITKHDLLTNDLTPHVETWCGKTLLVIQQTDAEPSDEDLCSQCWRNARCTQ